MDRQDPSPWPVLIAAVASLVVMAAATQPTLDWDAFWHLRVGQWIQEQGTVPTTDPLSRLGQSESRRWLAYSWLFEWLMACSVQAFGLAGLVWFRLGLVLVVVWVIQVTIWRHVPHWPTAGLLLLLTLFAVVPLVQYERPWLATIAFSWLTLGAVLRIRDGEPIIRLAWLPLVYAVWANVHIQFLFGLMLLALAFGSSVIEKWQPQDIGTPRPSPLGLGLLALACGAATLANPYHVEIYAVIREYASQPAAFAIVNDLKPLTFREPWDWAAVSLIGLSIWALARRERVTAFEVLLVVACAVLTLRARRDLWYAGAAVVAVVGTTRLIPWEPARITLPVRPYLPAIVLSALLIAGLGSHFLEGPMTERVMRKLPERYPVAAVAWVREHRPAGPIFNDFDWGGYLTYALPEYPVAIDGRTNLYGDEVLYRNLATWAGGPAWQQDPDLLAAQLVLANRQTALAQLLRLDPAWRLACDDDPLAVVFVRR